MTTTPDYLPVLSKGGHRNRAEGACFMEYASLLAGEEFSDHPECAHPVLAELARSVNDRLPDSERHRIAHLIPAVIGTADDREDETERRVLSVRLAVWCARQVLDLAADRERCEALVAAAQAWADCPCEEHRRAATTASAYTAYTAAAADAAAAYASAADAAAAAYAYAAVAYAAAADAAAASAAEGADRLIALLEGAFAEHARLTGRDALPTLTEDDAARLTALVGGLDDIVSGRVMAGRVLLSDNETGEGS